MKLKTLALATLFISAIKIKSQTNYDFNSYKYRVKIYQYKTGYFNSSSYNNLQGKANKYSGNTSWEKGYSYTGTQNSIAGGYDFYRFINTEEKQRVISTVSSLSLNHSSSRDFNSTFLHDYSVYSSAYSSGSVNLTGRNYKGKKFQYFQVNTSLSVNGINNINPGQNANRSKRAGGSYSFNIKYGFGTGRLELISDPVFAAFWLDDMKNKGVVDEYNANDIEALAKTITQIRNTRIIDFRFRTIDQIKMYDSFFMARGLISKTDAAYYTTIYDHYLYANNFSRYSGKRNTWYGLGKSFINYNFEKTSNPSSIQNINSNNSDFEAGIGFLHEKEKALNLHKQQINRTNVELVFNYSTYDFKNEITDTSLYIIHNQNERQNFYVYASQFFGRGHYFNTRSYLEYGTNVGLYLNQELTPRLDILPQIGFNLNYYYWFSPNLQLAIQGNINSINELNIYGKNFSQKAGITGSVQPNFNLRLNYTVF